MRARSLILTTCLMVIGTVSVPAVAQAGYYDRGEYRPWHGHYHYHGPRFYRPPVYYAPPVYSPYYPPPPVYYAPPPAYYAPPMMGFGFGFR